MSWVACGCCEGADLHVARDYSGIRIAVRFLFLSKFGKMSLQTCIDT